MQWAPSKGIDGGIRPKRGYTSRPLPREAAPGDNYFRCILLRPSEFNLTERDFLFGRVNWRKDRFSGYDQQLSESIGYGRRLIDTGVHFLNAEIGVGARQADLGDGTTEEDMIVRAGLNYLWKFSETAEFSQALEAESGPENIYAESVSAIKTSLIGALALVASYTVKNNSEVPLGSEKTDTFAALSLEYSF